MLPTFRRGVIIAKSEGRTYGIVSWDALLEDVEKGDAFSLVGADKFGELGQSKLCFESVGKLPCSFVLAMAENSNLQPTEPLRISTSNPRAFAAFAGRAGIQSLGEPRFVSGKVESEIGLGKADAIFDIREKGSTLAANGLKVVLEGDPIELGGMWLGARA